MALINCPECGKEISDKAMMCPNCGNPLTGISEEEMIELTDKNVKRKQAEKKRKITIISIIVVICIGIIAAIIIGNYIADKNEEYNQAIAAYENGNFTEAYQYFSRSDYRESSQYLTKTIYAMAVELYNYGEFDSAIETFEILDGYNDSEEYIKNAEFMKTIQGDWYLVNNYRGIKYYARININGAKATYYHGKNDKVAESELQIIANEKVLFNTENIQYTFTYYLRGSDYELRELLVGHCIKDEYFNNIRSTSYNYYGDDMAFARADELGIE